MGTANAEVTVEIARPLSEVFAFVTNYNNNVQWQEGVQDSQQLTPGEPGVGTQVSYTRQVAGQNIEARAQMTAFETDTRIRLTSKTKLYEYNGGYDFASIDDENTRVQFRGEIKTGRMLGLLGKKLARTFETQMTKDLNNLKRMFETGQL